jgi:hypothetical protein
MFKENEVTDELWIEKKVVVTWISYEAFMLLQIFECGETRHNASKPNYDKDMSTLILG